MPLNWNEKGLTLIEMIFSIAIILTLASAFYQLIVSFSRHYEIQDAVAEMQQQGRVAADLFMREIRQAGYDPTGELFDPDNNEKTKERKVYVVDPPDGPACQTKKHPVERVLEATTTSVQFLADSNGNKKVDNPTNDKGEDIRYEWVGGATPPLDLCGNHRTPYTLYRDTGGGMQEVAVNIQLFNLTYFDEDDNQLFFDIDVDLVPDPLLEDQRADIRKIVINLTARTGKKDSDYLENDGYRTRSFSAEIYLKNL